MLKHIYKECWRFRGHFLGLNVALVIMYVCEMIIPYVFSGFIDEITYSGSSLVLVRQPIVVIACTTVVLMLSAYAKSVLTEVTILKVSNRMLNELDDKLENLPLRDTAKHNPAYLNSRIFNDILTSVGFVIYNLVVAIIMGVSTLVLFYLISQIHVSILMIVLFAVVVNGVSILVLNKAMYKWGYAYRDQNMLYLSANNDRLASIKETKIHGWYDSSGEEVNTAFGKLLKVGISLNQVMALLNNIGTFTKNITLILTMVVGGKLLIDESITVGQLMLITSYTSMCLANTDFFLKLGQSYQQAKVCFVRIEEFTSAQDERNGTERVESISSIEVKNLYFAYQEMPPLYTGFNLRLDKGKIYCLKGKNGDGKSTLIDLILGLNDGYSGEILINGIALPEMDMKWMRKEKISVILQQPVVQRVSVEANIHRGLTYYSVEVMNYLLENLHIQKIMGVQDASTLSGGEKQKVAIVRGLLKASDVLILDEPVSAMDKEGIQILKKELVDRKEDKIILFISHNEELFDIVDEFVSL